MRQRRFNVAIAGATGAVGKTFLELFEERDFPFENLFFLASGRSNGKQIRFKNQNHFVQNLATFDFKNVDVAFFSAGTAVSKKEVPRATQAGCLVIDNTNAFRMHPEVPLVVPQVNGHLLHQRPDHGIISNPNCATIPVTRAMRPIARHFGLQKLVVSTYQAASGAGLSGIDELETESRGLLEGKPGLETSEHFGTPLAFNLVPHIDVLLENHFTLEEQKMLQESRKIMSAPQLNVTATAVRIPVIHCHSEAVYFECAEKLDREKIIQLLKSEEEMNVYDNPKIHGFPTPRFITSSNHVHVGRVRVNPQDERGGMDVAGER